MLEYERSDLEQTHMAEATVVWVAITLAAMLLLGHVLGQAVVVDRPASGDRLGTATASR